mgnify:CR=1 FL=1
MAEDNESYISDGQEASENGNSLRVLCTDTGYYDQARTSVFMNKNNEFVQAPFIKLRNLGGRNELNSSVLPGSSVDDFWLGFHF